jgi:site-specific DNA recombinase
MCPPALIQGRPQTAGSVARVPAVKIEAAIVGAVRAHIGPDAPSDDSELITTCVHRIEMRRTEIAVALLSEDHASNGDITPSVLTVPWSKTPHRRRRDVIAPEGASPAAVLPIRADSRVKLVTAIARGRQWLSEIETGTATVDGIAAREACSKRHVSMTISLAFPASSRPLSMVGCRAESVSPACSMHRSHGRVSNRCWGSHTDAAHSTQWVIYRL